MEPTDSPSRTARALAWLARNGSALVIGSAFATVVGTTGFVSYTHICALMLQAHQSWKTAHVTAVFVDGQMVIGSMFYMIAAGRTRFWGLVGIVPGVAESLYANWESGIVYGVRDALIAAVAAQVLAGSTFLFERWLKAQGGGQVARVVTIRVGCGHGVAASRDERILDAWSHLSGCLGGEPTFRGVGLMLGIHNEIVRQVVTAVADGGSSADEAPVLVTASANGSAP